MPKQQHQPWDIKTFNKGAQKDTDKEFLGADPKGEYVDAKNMRPTALDGDTGAIEKIGGESLKYELLENDCHMPTPYYPFSTNYKPPITPVAAEYMCMGAEEINGKFVDIWADKNNVAPPIVRINGIVVLKSSNFPIKTTCPLQTAKNENCVGGEIYITDYCVEPMLFNIKDMMDNGGIDGGACTTKYFSAFNPDDHKINLKRPLDHPVFVDAFPVSGTPKYSITNGDGSSGAIVVSQGGSSLPVGYYQYAIRYGFTAGDRTAWSVATPLIPILETISTDTNIYPLIRNVSSAPNSAGASGYGIKIRFRLNNVNKYDFCEIKRISYNNGDPLSATPTPILIKTITGLSDKATYPLPCIIDFIDKGATSEGDLSPDVETEVIGVINRAKAIRYYNSRLYLMNIEYAKRDIEKSDLGLVPAADGNIIYPFLRNVGQAGFHSTFNTTNYKSYERGERYSFAMVFHDEKGDKSFAVPLQDNYKFPNRRDAVSADTRAAVQAISKGDQYNSNKSVTAADSSSAVTDTHEVFDMKDAKRKDNVVMFNNVLGALTAQRRLSKIKSYADYTDGSPYAVNSFLGIDYIKSTAIGYKPLRPTGSDDTLVENTASSGTFPYYTDTGVSGAHEQVINTQVAQRETTTIGSLVPSIPDTSQVNIGAPTYGTSADLKLRYQPKGFAPNYYTMGGAIKKVTFPDWAVSANIVRSKPARRVIAQGIGFYKLNEADFAALGNASLATKEKSKLVFYSADVDAGFINTSEIADIGTSGNYKIELVSPLGFFSEVYGGDVQDLGGRDRNVDMISYLRVLQEDGSINSGDVPTGVSARGATVGTGGYVQYGKWRNINTSSFEYSDLSNLDSSGNTKQWPISAFNEITTEERGTYFEITVNNINTGQTLYRNGSTGGPSPAINAYVHFENSGVKDFHEPVYIINIIKEENTVEEKNVEEYLETGHYLKKESLIGVWSDSTLSPLNEQFYYIVDERWEDCITNSYSPSYATQTRYLYVKKPSGTVQVWQDVTGMATIDIVNLITLGTVDGVYTHSVTSDEFYKIIFKEPTAAALKTIYDGVGGRNKFLPEDGDSIYCKYNNDVPISFFGGDTFIGESMFNMIDRRGDSNSNIGNQFKLAIPMPYHYWEVNPRIYIPNNATSGGSNKIQDKYALRLQYIRQHAIMASVEQSLAIQYMYTNDSANYVGDATAIMTNKIFGQVHYVMRPNKWTYSDNWNTGSSPGLPGGGEVEIYGAYVNTDYKEYTNASGGNPNNNWELGGIHSPSQITLCMNIDYSKDANTLVDFTKPKVGYNEEALYCTRVIWSEKRELNMVDSPGVKTFPALNYFDISDDTGSIKRAYDASSEKGSNLYAFTDSGICLLVTDKNEVVDAKISEVALMSVSSQLGVQDQFWLSKTVGMSDEMWRSAAEYNNAIYFANNNSVYKFTNNNVGDIGKLGYTSKISSDFLDAVGAGYTTELSACYDIYNSEYWITFKDSGGNKKTFAYNDATQHWNGQYDYDYDKYISYERKTYGMKWSNGTTGGTFELNSGYRINGSIIEAYVSQACSPKQILSKEFIRIRIASDNKPIQVDFSYTDGGANLCSLSQAIQGVRYLKDYGAFEQYIPREQSGNKYRLQGRLLIYKIIHNLEEHFEIVDVGVQYKLLK